MGRARIAADLQQAIVRALSTFPDVAVAYAFGSVVRGDAREDSDLDIGIVLRDRDEAELSGLRAAHLAAALSRETGFEAIDVVDLEAQGPIFVHDVLCEAALVYEADPQRRVDFESETLSRALDFRPTHELATRGKIAAMRRWLEERYDL